MSQHRLDNPIVRNDSLYLSFLSMNPIQPKKEFKIKMTFVTLELPTY